MTADAVLNDLKKNRFAQVYWLEGDEPFFIHQVVEYAEKSILTEAETGFNLTVFYGRDAGWADVINACRRYPMFSEKQVVIIKEAQDLKGLDKLEAYVEAPLTSTLLFVAYVGKKVDGRSKLARLLKEKAAFVSTRKMYDSALPEWTAAQVAEKGFTVTKKALFLLIDHIGNDLSRLRNEIDKLSLNLQETRQITENEIERFIGVSKEFNVFELQQAVATRDLPKAVRIINYFGANPKAAPLPLIFPSLYNFFSKVQAIHSLPAKDEATVATGIGVNRYFAKDYIGAASRYDQADTERVMLLLHEYNLRNLGINDAGTDDAELLKEMTMKMIA